MWREFLDELYCRLVLHGLCLVAVVILFPIALQPNTMWLTVR